MPLAPLAIFTATYLGVAFGRIPGLNLDRTGIALLGAIAMIASGSLPLAQAMEAIDLPTILLLYALMVVSAQLRLGGFYTRVACRTTGLLARPRFFLLCLMLLAALLSALLANDIVCLAFTPVLALTLLRSGRNPLPFLLGLAVASNIGSAATIIGNPQNMLLGQMGRLDFARFLFWCGPPSLLALAGSWLVLLLLFRHSLGPAGPEPSEEEPPGPEAGWPAYDPWQSGKGVAAILLIVGLFFTSIPRELSALTVAGLLLCSRKMRSRQIMALVDWHLITLFCALFIVVHGIAVHRIPEEIMGLLASLGIAMGNLPTLAAVGVVMSNLVSNVPAVMLLIRFLDPAVPEQWYVLALASTFAGNLLLIGSIANLIVVEQAREFGIEIGFKDHARAGIPVTLLSMAVLLLML